MVSLLASPLQSVAAAAEPAANSAKLANNAAVPTANAQELADGTYSLGYTFLKYNTAQVSVMQDYVIPTGRLIVQNGQKLVQITLKQSKEITQFKLEQGGQLVSPEVVATDEKANTRTIQFAVDDLSAKVKGWVKIYWQVSPTFLYDHEYDIHLTFDSSSLKLLSSTEANAETDTESTDAGSFKDIEQHWAQSAIARAVSLGLVSGYVDGTFRPESSITRAEFAVLLSRAMKLGTSSAKETSFSDNARIPAWVKPYLGPVVEAGVINGFADGSFRADSTINRTELAVMVVRALKLEVDSAAKPAYADTDTIPKWAQAEVAAAASAGIMNVHAGNKFAPLVNATRAEAVSAILALAEAQS